MAVLQFFGQVLAPPQIGQAVVEQPEGTPSLILDA